MELVLVQPGGPMHDDATAERIRELLATGAMGAGVFETDDCRRTYEELRDRGVEFLSPPRDRPYGHRSDVSRRLWQLVQPDSALNRSLAGPG